MVDMSNKKVKDVELPAVFGEEVKSHLLHSAVVNQLANRRAGTAATKTKGLVSGGGTKPFKQKVRRRVKHRHRCGAVERIGPTRGYSAACRRKRSAPPAVALS
jgi:large subunit ribosomal protein L4